MGRFAVGQVVSSTFPFSDLTAQKRRPAIIVAIVDFEDLILCQITSKPYASRRAIPLTATDFKSGQLPRASYIRPDKLFTADTSIVDRTLGSLNDKKLSQVKALIRKLFE